MDWMNRNDRPNQPINQGVNHANATAGPASHNKRPKSSGPIKMASIALLFSVSFLLLALLLYTVFSGRTSNEGKYVDTHKYQAVFLNGGQVYFGHIKTLSSKYLRIDNIYYLRVNQQVQPNQTNTQTANDVSLVKLGCELHGPDDEMVVNRDQIIFWENLKTDGQVAKAIAQFIQTNPNGQNCTTTAPASTTTPTTPAPATTTPSTKKQ